MKEEPTGKPASPDSRNRHQSWRRACDILVYDELQQLVRPTVIACFDVYTGAIVGLTLESGTGTSVPLHQE